MLGEHAVGSLLLGCLCVACLLRLLVISTAAAGGVVNPRLRLNQRKKCIYSNYSTEHNQSRAYTLYPPNSTHASVIDSCRNTR